MTIDQINNNPVFAPIGHEEEFKRRIFLDNFRRCMTIREFQKTAGLEIKKKVEATPTALAMREVMDYNWNEHKKYNCGINEYQSYNKRMEDFTLPYPTHLFRYLPMDMRSSSGRIFENYFKKDYQRHAKLYTTKKSNYETIIKSREDLFKQAHRYYEYKIKLNYSIDDKIYRIGYWNFWNIITYVFIKYYKKWAQRWGNHSEWVFLGNLVECYNLETKKIDWNEKYGHIINIPHTKIDIYL